MSNPSTQRSNPSRKKKVILFGAGGAARAIAYGLQKNNCEVIIFNRTWEKAQDLAREFGLQYDKDINNLKNYDYDILINATSVGFDSNNQKSIIDSSFILKDTVVLDVVTHPVTTPLLKMAQEKNCQIIPGYKMLIYQAMFQIELWTGKKPDFITMQNAILKLL